MDKYTKKEVGLGEGRANGLRNIRRTAWVPRGINTRLPHAQRIARICMNRYNVEFSKAA